MKIHYLTEKSTLCFVMLVSINKEKKTGGEMTQAMYAHMNNKRKKKERKKKTTSHFWYYF
jgi:hypothetical protein